MKINKLLELQANGVFKFQGNPTKQSAVIGGQSLNNDQCIILARQMGWTGRTANCGWEMIDKTGKFVTNVKRNVKNENFINTVDVQFESMRKSDTIKIVDRIVIQSSTGVNLTIIHGGEGLGGSFALFNPNKSISQPEAAFSSYKAIFDYIVSYYF